MFGSTRFRAPIRFVLCIGVGLAAAIYAIALTQSDPRTAAVGWAALVGGVGLLSLGSTRRVSLALVAILALTLPIFIAKFFFLHVRAADQYVEHTGNLGIQLSLPVLAAAAILLVQFVSSPAQRILSGFRLEPLTATGAGLCIVTGVLSLFNAYDAKLVGFELLRFALLYMLTFVVANLDRHGTRVYLGALALAVALEGFLAVGQFGAGGTLGLGFLGEMDTRAERIEYVDIVRPSGTLGNANGLGGFFSLTLPLLLGLILTTENGRARLFYAAAFTAGLAGIIVTLSRGSWITLPLNLMVVAIVVSGRRIFSLKAAAIMAVGMIAVAIAAIAVGPLIVTRIFGDDAGSALSRVPINLAAWSVIKQFPLFGVGLNNFADALVRHDQTGFVQAHMAGIDNSLLVHNLYLLVWSETGVIGLVAFLWYLGSAFFVAYAVLRSTDHPQDRAIAIGVAMGLFAQMVQGIFDIGFRAPLGSAGALVAAQIGLLAGLRLQRGRREVFNSSQPSRRVQLAGAGRGTVGGAGLTLGILVILLLATGPAGAANLTVGPTGTYPTLQRVPWNNLRPGDQVILEPGLVHHGSLTISARGRSEAPIRIAAAAGSPRPVIHGTLLLAGAEHVIVEGLIVEDAKEVGVGIVKGSRSITVQNMVLRRNGMGVWIAMAAGGSHRIIDNEMSQNGTHGVGIDKIANRVGEETLIANNRIFDNGHHGIDVTGSRFIVEGNTIYDNGRTQFGTSGIMLYAGGFRGTTRLGDMGSHNIVRYNTIFRQHDDKTWDGNGIEADLWANDNEISYNICYDNDGAGIIIFGSARNRVFNNTLIGNFRDSANTHLPGGELTIATGDPPHGDAIAAGTIAKNNILVATRAKSHAIYVDRLSAMNGTQVGGNLLFRLGEGKLFVWEKERGDDIKRWNMRAKSNPADSAADPLFVDMDDRPNGLRLRPDSPGVRLGQNLGLTRDHAGTRLDATRSPSAGAFELSSQPSLTPAPEP